MQLIASQIETLTYAGRSQAYSELHQGRALSEATALRRYPGTCFAGGDWSKPVAGFLWALQ